ncbi:MAG: hypothetical protein NTY66_01090 [Candidatus Vogelbacteria bacterium]|nr:hypothetical protein [Candidatus Vogelbacteria bacterium]
MEETLTEKLEAIRHSTAGCIAVTGGAPAGSDDTVVAGIVEEFVAKLAGKNLAIVGNGTKWGVPKYAAEAAIAHGIPLIRIFPERARKHLLSIPGAIDIPISPRCFSPEWGIEHHEPVIYGVALSGTGGLADLVYDGLRPLWQSKIAVCLPADPISSGRTAAEFLLAHLKR